MLSSTQLATMLDLQNKMNTKVNPQWLTAGYQYLRAAMIEAVEGIEHHGWKWWKAQQLDLPQLQMEMVDIWHFALSAILIENNGNIEKSAQVISGDLKAGPSTVTFDGKGYDFISQTLLDNLQLMAGLCAASRFDVPLFMHIVKQCDMQADDLYKQYVGKNILNFFRQDHGYKTGEYVKNWQDREDNEHLVEVLEEINPEAANYSDQIYAGLSARYPIKA